VTDIKRHSDRRADDYRELVRREEKSRRANNHSVELDRRDDDERRDDDRRENSRRSEKERRI